MSKSWDVYGLFTSWREDTIVVHPHLVHWVPEQKRIDLAWLVANRLRLTDNLLMDQTWAVIAHRILRIGLGKVSLNAYFPDLLDLRVFYVDWRMSLFPFVFEVLELLSVDLAAIVGLIVLLDLGYSLELLNDLLVMASTLSSSSFMEVLLKGLENLWGSK